MSEITISENDVSILRDFTKRAAQIAEIADKDEHPFWAHLEDANDVLLELEEMLNKPTKNK